MNKNFKLYLSVWAIFLALFNVVAFVSPAEIAGADKFSGAFWPCYVLITLAFVGQLACSYVAFK